VLGGVAQHRVSTVEVPYQYPSVAAHVVHTRACSPAMHGSRQPEPKVRATMVRVRREYLIHTAIPHSRPLLRVGSFLSTLFEYRFFEYPLF
jgi:hypothetical protein